MKFKILISLVALALLCSCKKTFEEKPLQFISEDYIWDVNDPAGNNAQRFLTKVYTQLPDGYNRINGLPLECMSDDAVPSAPGNAVWNIINGGYSPIATFDDNWTNCYSAIRRCNMFLANYEQVPWADSNLKKWLANEARALRAIFYYEMLKRYGGVPLIGDKIFEANDPNILTLKRSSFEDCVNYILAELSASEDNLRPDASLSSRGSGNSNGNGVDIDAGRLRKSTVMAIRAKLLLLAASPLFNPSATPDKAYTGYPTFSAERWKVAADAAKAIMDLGLFQLETNPYALSIARVNRETIFQKNYGVANLTMLYSPVGFVVSNTRSTGIVSPTQELVNAFPMKNGKPITDPSSGYDPLNPYTNRDPRLSQTIFFNGIRWLRRSVETFEGGLDKPNTLATIPVQTVSGYYLKKQLPNDAEATSYTANATYWNIIRYADILLMYAEAMNEYSGVSQPVITAVETLRQRAGLSPFTIASAYGATTKDSMREIIRNERRIELAFEEQRFWDIRRWKIAQTVYKTTLHGIRIVKNNNGSLSYTSTNIATPYFTNAMYLFPISYSETVANPGLAQNPGY